MTKFEKLGRSILRHKYLYYIKAETEINDFEYDALEREYALLARKIKKEPKIHMIMDWQEVHGDDFTVGGCYTHIGFPHSHPWAKELLILMGDHSFDDLNAEIT